MFQQEKEGERGRKMGKVGDENQTQTERETDII